MGGFILICLGLISMYIGKMYEEVRNRPLYIVRERVNFGEDINTNAPLETKDNPKS